MTYFVELMEVETGETVCLGNFEKDIAMKIFNLAKDTEEEHIAITVYSGFIEKNGKEIKTNLIDSKFTIYG